MNIYDFYITPEEYSIAESNGISKKTLEYRIREASWDKEKAISIKPNVRKRIPKEIKELAYKNGISISTLKSRINLLGWNLIDAATIPIMDSGKNIYKAIAKVRKYPKEFIELAEKNGISAKCFYNRVKKYKWSLEKASTTPIMTSREIGLMNKEHGKKVLDMIFSHNKKNNIRN